MIHEWIAASTCDNRKVIHMQYAYLWNNIMVVSQVIISGITLGPHVYQFVTNMFALAVSSLMMQLCRHYWEVKNLQQPA